MSGRTQNEVSVQANMSEANVKPRSGGRRHIYGFGSGRPLRGLNLLHRLACTEAVAGGCSTGEAQ